MCSKRRDPREITDELGVTGIIQRRRRRKYARERRAHLLGIVEYRLRRKFEVCVPDAPAGADHVTDDDPWLRAA